ncbi:MAG: class I adenylate-forming enzyme family protein, partial [Thermomicrobiales bacterium]
LEGWAESQPDAVALRSLDGDDLTFRALSRQMRDTRLRLRELGIGPQDRVAVVMLNGPLASTAALSVLAACVLAPLHPAAPATEVRSLMERIRPAAVLVLPGGEDSAEMAAALGLPVLRVRPRGASPFLFDLEGAPVGPAAVDRRTTLDDLTMISATSGTTGRPKLVARSHWTVGRPVPFEDVELGLAPGDRTLVLTSLAFALGYASLMRALRAGSMAVVPPDFDADALPGWLDEHDPTWLYLVPVILSRLTADVAAGNAARNPGLRLIRCGSAPLDPGLRERAERVLGIPIFNAYGSSEGGSIAVEGPGVARRPGTAGRVSCPLRIVEDGRLVADGDPGEIEVSGPGVFPGYWDDPEATAAVFTEDGWLRTGDRGVLVDGYVVLLGRIDEVINCGGAKVDPEEVDVAIRAFPGVLDAAAYPLPHPRKGQEVAAAVVLAPGHDLDRRALRRWLLNRLSPHKMPTAIQVVDVLPRNANGKVQRAVLSAETVRA